MRTNTINTVIATLATVIVGREVKHFMHSGGSASSYVLELRTRIANVIAPSINNWDIQKMQDVAGFAGSNRYAMTSG